MSGKTIAMVALLAVAVLVVILPALIALIRQHPERRTICKLTPFAIVSFVLWGVLLVWAITGIRDDAAMTRYVARLRRSRLLPYAIAGLVVTGLLGTGFAMLG